MKNSILNILKPGDYIISGVIILMIILQIYFSFITADNQKIIEITDYKNNLYRYPVTDKIKVNIPGPYGMTVIQIYNKKVWVQKASCPYKTCKKMGPIKRKGDMIICIPNRVLVRIIGKNYDLDGISR